jgi:hypothetical protein
MLESIKKKCKKNPKSLHTNLEENVPKSFKASTAVPGGRTEGNRH